MRAAFSLAILALLNATHAVRIQDSLAETPSELSQVDANSASVPPLPYYDNDCCDDHDDQYYCPPALQKGPGVIQPPSPSKLALCNRPLCYCNSGFMHTDWDHNVSVDDEACEHCKGGKKSKKPHGKSPPIRREPQGYVDQDIIGVGSAPPMAPMINEEDLIILGPGEEAE